MRPATLEVTLLEATSLEATSLELPSLKAASLEAASRMAISREAAPLLLAGALSRPHPPRSRGAPLPDEISLLVGRRADAATRA